MCKTAFSILAERSAKFAAKHNCTLDIYFEECGKKEDRAIQGYLKELKANGSPFNQANSNGYSPLTAEDFKRIIPGMALRKTKKVPMIQLADLVLFPIVKGGYDPDYLPYQKLRQNQRLIDCHLSEEEIVLHGIKYSCFSDR